MIIFIRKLVFKAIDTVSPRTGLISVFNEANNKRVIPSPESNQQAFNKAAVDNCDTSDIADNVEINSQEIVKSPLSFEGICLLYPLPNSPFQQELQQTVYRVYNQHIDNNNELPMNIKNALYFGIERYIGRRQYNQNVEDYLNGLLADVEQGKRHYNEVCFYDRGAEDVFRSIKYTLVDFITNNRNTFNED